MLACAYLEGTWSEVYPHVGENVQGLQRLFRQFSTPGGIPSHCSPDVPGSINEGGELGYVLLHAFGAVMDQPDLIALALVGDGEAETGPLEGSWKSIKFINPTRDGAVLPVLHLNGYKIAGPTVLGRETDENIQKLFEGHGYKVYFVEGDDPNLVHPAIARALEACVADIKEIQAAARHSSAPAASTPRWPMIVLRTPKGWTGPKKVDGIQVEGTWRSHQVPLSGVKEQPDHLKILEEWLRSYKPDELFDENGKLVGELQALAPTGDKRMSAQPVTNPGDKLFPFQLPDFSKFAVKVDAPASIRHPNTAPYGTFLRDVYKLNPHTFRLFCPVSFHTLSNNTYSTRIPYTH